MCSQRTLSSRTRASFTSCDLLGRPCTGSRGGKDYEEIVRPLRSKYDRPRETCRIVLHKYMQHELDPTVEGLGRTMSLLQKTISTLKECSDFTGPTIMAIMTELMMSETLFREWSKKTSTTRKPPSAHQLIDFVKQYRRALAVQPGAAKQGSKPTSKPGLRLCTPPARRRPIKASAFHVQSPKDCGVCRNGSHSLYQFSAFKEQSTEDRNSMA